MKSEYEDCKIVNIRYGSKSSGRDSILYAHLVDKYNNLLISATLDYIVGALRERLKNGVS